MAADRSSGGKRSCGEATAAIRFSSSGIERSPLRSPASTCASAPVAAAAPRRRASSSCRRRRGPSRGARGTASATTGDGATSPCPGRAGTPARAARARRRRRPTSLASQCCPVCRTTSSMPASRNASETGPDLMNCGRLPTTREPSPAEATMAAVSGPLAQLAEQGTLNPKVGGSIPPRPTPACVRAQRRHAHRALAVLYAGSRGSSLFAVGGAPGQLPLAPGRPRWAYLVFGLSGSRLRRPAAASSSGGSLPHGNG